MNVNQMVEAVEGIYPVLKSKVVYISVGFVVCVPITMPEVTKKALLKCWNTLHAQQYGADPEKLWVGDLTATVSQKPQVFGDIGPLPHDVLIDKMQSVEVDVSSANWRDELKLKFVELDMAYTQGLKQVYGLMQQTMSTFVPEPIVTLKSEHLAQLPEVLMKAEVANALVARARKTVAPKVLDAVYAVTTQPLNCQSAVYLYTGIKPEWQQKYEWYDAVSHSLS